MSGSQYWQVQRRPQHEGPRDIAYSDINQLRSPLQGEARAQGDPRDTGGVELMGFLGSNCPDDCRICEMQRLATTGIETNAGSARLRGRIQGSRLKRPDEIAPHTL